MLLRYRREMENEMRQLMKMCVSVVVSLSYCYGLCKKLPKGLPRLLFLLPVLCLFLYLPLNISSVHFVGLSGFIISWRANFKLLLFAFDKGPLSSSSISLPVFVTLACLPIKIQQNQSPKSHNFENQSHNVPIQPKRSHHFNNVTKFLLLVILAQTYDHRNHINPKIMQFIYCVHIYLILELGLAMVAYMARGMLELELEAPFNEPCLSTSLQVFWGRRWNLIVSSILRPKVYDPALLFGTRVVGQKFARIVAVLATFFVSGVMHELIFYYLGRAKPTWEVFCFFILHGVCLIVEIVLKKALKGRYQLSTVISVILTLGFIIVTGFWLFLPQFIRFRVYDRAFDEYATIGRVLKEFDLRASWVSLSIYST